MKAATQAVNRGPYAARIAMNLTEIKRCLRPRPKGSGREPED